MDLIETKIIKTRDKLGPQATANQIKLIKTQIKKASRDLIAPLLQDRIDGTFKQNVVAVHVLVMWHSLKLTKQSLHLTLLLSFDLFCLGFYKLGGIHPL